MSDPELIRRIRLEDSQPEPQHIERPAEVQMVLQDLWNGDLLLTLEETRWVRAALNAMYGEPELGEDS